MIKGKAFKEFAARTKTEVVQTRKVTTTDGTTVTINNNAILEEVEKDAPVDSTPS